MAKSVFCVAIVGRLLACCAVAFLSVGCQSTTQPPTRPAAPVIAEPVTVETPRPVPATPSFEQRLLLQAQLAFRDGRYTTPEHDNAYDRFQALLVLNPEHEQARAGVQAILIQYAQLVRLALGEGRLATARHYLETAETYYPANPLLMDLKQQLRARSQAFEEDARRSVGKVAVLDEIPLPRAELNQKSASVKQQLAEIAMRLRETDESVLIFARNDREGRWIYQQLKKAVEGYRVRGDIRIDAAPKIKILPPL